MSDTLLAGCETVVRRTAASTVVRRPAASTVMSCVLVVNTTPPVATPRLWSSTNSRKWVSGNDREWI